MSNLDATHNLLIDVMSSIIRRGIEWEKFPTSIRKDSRHWMWFPVSKKYTGKLEFHICEPAPETDYTFYISIGHHNIRLLKDGKTLVVRAGSEEEARYKVSSVDETNTRMGFAGHVWRLLSTAFWYSKPKHGGVPRPPKGRLSRTERIARRTERRRLRRVSRHIGRRRMRAMSLQR